MQVSLIPPLDVENAESEKIIANFSSAIQGITTLADLNAIFKQYAQMANNLLKRGSTWNSCYTQLRVIKNNKLLEVCPKIGKFFILNDDGEKFVKRPIIPFVKLPLPLTMDSSYKTHICRTTHELLNLDPTDPYNSVLRIITFGMIDVHNSTDFPHKYYSRELTIFMQRMLNDMANHVKEILGYEEHVSTVYNVEAFFSELANALHPMVEKIVELTESASLFFDVSFIHYSNFVCRQLLDMLFEEIENTLDECQNSVREVECPMNVWDVYHKEVYQSLLNTINSAKARMKFISSTFDKKQSVIYCAEDLQLFLNDLSEEVKEFMVIFDRDALMCQFTAMTGDFNIDELTEEISLFYQDTVDKIADLRRTILGVPLDETCLEFYKLVYSAWSNYWKKMVRKLVSICTREDAPCTREDAPKPSSNNESSEKESTVTQKAPKAKQFKRRKQTSRPKFIDRPLMGNVEEVLPLVYIERSPYERIQLALESGLKDVCTETADIDDADLRRTKRDALDWLDMLVEMYREEYPHFEVLGLERSIGLVKGLVEKQKDEEKPYAYKFLYYCGLFNITKVLPLLSGKEEEICLKKVYHYLQKIDMEGPITSIPPEYSDYIDDLIVVFRACNEIDNSC